MEKQEVLKEIAKADETFKETSSGEKIEALRDAFAETITDRADEGDLESADGLLDLAQDLGVLGYLEEN